MAFEKDRRRFARAEAAWPVTIITSYGQFPGETKSISQAGVSIHCRDLPTIGRECRLEIQPPDHQPITVSARSIWAVETDLAEVSRPFVVGFEFEYISEGDVHYLGEVIAEQQQQKE